MSYMILTAHCMRAILVLVNLVAPLLRWKKGTMRPLIRGIHHVKIPVTSLQRSREFYESILDLSVLIEFRDDDGVVRGVAYGPVGGVSYALREDPERAAALAGYDPVAFTVDDDSAIDAWITHLNGLGIENSGRVQGAMGSVLGFADPDGISVVLYANATPESDDTDRN
jgi:catechol 2,3-dioxygenase-like lactoylglutathione lyase family enzyme